MKGDCKFPRMERLKRREDVKAVFKKGVSVSCPGAKLFFLLKEGTERRIAFTFSRKFGNAVARNRARRLGREAYRHLRSGIRDGCDMALLVYPTASKPSEGGLSKNGLSVNAISFRMRQLRTLLGKAGLLAEVAGMNSGAAGAAGLASALVIPKASGESAGV
jgi:ribonuclease P protein component